MWSHVEARERRRLAGADWTTTSEMSNLPRLLHKNGAFSYDYTGGAPALPGRSLYGCRR